MYGEKEGEREGGKDEVPRAGAIACVRMAGIRLRTHCARYRIFSGNFEEQKRYELFRVGSEERKTRLGFLSGGEHYFSLFILEGVTVCEMSTVPLISYDMNTSKGICTTV